MVLRCPTTEETWNQRSAEKACSPEANYHCLQTPDGDVTEVCKSPIWIVAGKILVSGSKQVCKLCKTLSGSNQDIALCKNLYGLQQVCVLCKMLSGLKQVLELDKNLIWNEFGM
jgi:hypothetical protein